MRVAALGTRPASPGASARAVLTRLRGVDRVTPAAEKALWVMGTRVPAATRYSPRE
jgi:hypothetical protein